MADACPKHRVDAVTRDRSARNPVNIILSFGLISAFHDGNRFEYPVAEELLPGKLSCKRPGRDLRTQSRRLAGVAEIGAEDRVAIVVDRKIALDRPPESCTAHGQNIFCLSVDSGDEDRIDTARKGFLYFFAESVAVGTLSVGVDKEGFFDQFECFTLCSMSTTYNE